jgi:hypothetical protein
LDDSAGDSRRHPDTGHGFDGADLTWLSLRLRADTLQIACDALDVVVVLGAELHFDQPARRRVDDA